jgi:hypothetical protein
MLGLARPRSLHPGDVGSDCLLTATTKCEGISNEAATRRLDPITYHLRLDAFMQP